jgi:hypothetical protein
MTDFDAVRRDWLSRVRITEDDLSPSMLRRIAAMLDLDPDGFPRGTVLPHIGSACFAARAPARARSVPTATPSPALSCPRSRCPAAWAPVAASRSWASCAWATRW